MPSAAFAAAWAMAMVASAAGPAGPADGPTTAAAATAATASKEAATATPGEPRLIEDFEAAWQEGRWTFSNGPEFPGAAGRFERSQAAARSGQWGGQLHFDFSGGGNYVAAILRLDKAPDVAALRLWLKKPKGHRLTFRYTDQTGQTVQKSFWAPDERWADVTIPIGGWTGHWGGANDGAIHGPPKQIAFLVENNAGKQGSILLDDLRIVEGKPQKGAGMIRSEYVAARFIPQEGWHVRTSGPAGGSRLDGRKLRFDFSQGASSVGIVPDDQSLLGLPRQIAIRVRGKAPGHPVRLQVATHFMTFEKTVGEGVPNALEGVGGPFVEAGGGESRVVTPAPPGEGWRWFGGENDGKLHGPLRIRGIFLDAAGKTDSGELELLDIRVQTDSPPDRCCVLTADLRQKDGRPAFVAAIRNVGDKPIQGEVVHAIRDWAGKALVEGRTAFSAAPTGEPADVAVPLPDGEHRFLEAEFALEAAGQLIPPIQAYYTAPIEPRPAGPLNAGSPFGMGIYLYRYGGDAAGLGQMDRAAALAAAAGVKWSREEFAWNRIEPRKGQLDWTFYDKLIATAGRHGISIYGLMGYWAPWVKAYTPEGIEDYCRFAAAAAERYRDSIRHWEVWNEPNIFFWQGPRDMYAELLTKAYAAIKKANPQAAVLGCSTAGIDAGFIRRTMELGAPFDILTIHPYRQRLDDRAFIAELARTAELVRRPDGTPRQVWITEMGWATHTPHNAMHEGFGVTTQREQACLLARAYIDAIASGAAPNISWYDFRNDGLDPFNFEHNLGVVTRDFQPKPAFRAFATVAAMLEGKRADGAVDLGKEIVACRFVSDGGGGGGTVVVAFWSTGEDRDVALPLTELGAPAGLPRRRASEPPRAGAALIDLMGNRQSLAPADGRINVLARRDAPAFIVLGQ